MRTWLRLHGHALGSALRRMLSQPVSALVSALVLALAISLPVMATVALGTVGAAVSGLDTDPHVNVYLALDAQDEDVKRVGDALRRLGDVESVRFIPRAEALEELRVSSHLADVLAALDSNPLPHAFTVRVKGTAEGRVEVLRRDIGALPKVEQVAADFEWPRRIARWVGFGKRLLLGAGMLLAAAIVFIVGHLIRLQVLTHRDEIEVSQLIGATAADVRRPLVYHGALQGLVAGALAVALSVGMVFWAEREMLALTHGYGAELKMVLPPPIHWAAVIVGAGLLGMGGAWLAVSRELRRFSSP